MLPSILRCVLAGLLGFAVSVPTARANWQYTQWDMSPDEVIAASDGQAVPTTRMQQARWRNAFTGQTALLRARHSLGPGLDFMVNFYFTESNKLGTVALAISNKQGLASMDEKFKAVHEILDREYGTAEDKQNALSFRISVWHDKSNAEQITLTTLTDSELTVRYVAPPTPARIGDVSGTRQVWVESCRPEQAALAERDWKEFLSRAPDNRLRDEAQGAYAAAIVRTRQRATDPGYLKRVCAGRAVDGVWKKDLSTFDWHR